MAEPEHKPPMNSTWSETPQTSRKLFGVGQPFSNVFGTSDKDGSLTPSPSTRGTQN